MSLIHSLIEKIDLYKKRELINSFIEKVNFFESREKKYSRIVEEFNKKVSELLNKEMRGEPSEWINTISKVHRINCSYRDLLKEVSGYYLEKKCPSLEDDLKILNSRLLDYNS